ncbi:MAG: acyl-CoA carboxylase epsilon subunit [Kineosporiaceae bacterium]
MTVGTREPAEPSDEEVAAAVAALVTVLAQRPAPAPPPRRSAWGDPAHGFRRPLAPSPGRWQSPAARLR